MVVCYYYGSWTAGHMQMDSQTRADKLCLTDTRILMGSISAHRNHKRCVDAHLEPGELPLAGDDTHFDELL